jgi:acyl carrier protein
MMDEFHGPERDHSSSATLADLDFDPALLVPAVDPAAKLIKAVSDFLELHNRPAVPAMSMDSEIGGDLGLDSLEKVDLFIHIEKSFGVSIDPDESTQVETLGDLCALIGAHGGEARAPAGETQRAISISELERHLIQEVPHFLNEVQAQTGRQLAIDGRSIHDFASANYLGLDLDERIFDQITQDLKKWGTHPSWTRAVASPLPYAELEAMLAKMTNSPDTLVFPTVTLIHLGILPLLASDDVLFLMDERAHKSIQEGVALARAKGGKTAYFKHNDLDDLRRQLDAGAHFRAIYICIDGVFSMTGYEAKISEMVAVCRSYPNATIYVDDAHGFGLLGADPSPDNPYGSGGGGLCRKYGIDYAADRVIYVAGLSKAFSSLAAFVTCRTPEERELFSTASTFVNSGPCPVASLSSAKAGLAISQSEEGDAIRRKVYDLSKRLVEGVRDVGLVVHNENYFPLVSVEIGSITAVTRAAQILWNDGLLITPAVYPNAPIKQSMLRFTLTAANTIEEVDAAIASLEVIRDEIPSAPYA